MKSIYQIVVVILASLVFINPSHADNLGRIFTTLDERKELEKIRHTIEKPKEVEPVAVEEIIEIPVVETETETVTRDAITLKGLVHRSDGKSTAWINDSNTFEGDLESQFIQVPDSKIKSDQVTIIMPDDSTKVELKVGDAFTPKPIEREVSKTIETEGER